MADGLTKKQKTLKSANDKDRLARFKKRFLADFRADKKWRKNKDEDGRFYDGYQWEPNEVAILKDRNQPDVVINRCKNKVDGICGIQLGLRVDTKAYPTGDRKNEAEYISQRLREIEDASSFDEAESLAFEDIVIEGRSWYEVKKCWEGLKAYYKIERASNDDWVKDKNSHRADLSDAKQIHHTVWMDLEEAKGMFPGKEKEIETSSLDKDFLDPLTILSEGRVRPDQYKNRTSIYEFSDDDYGCFADEDARRIRVVTTYYRTISVEKFFYHPTLESPIDVTDSQDSEIEKMQLAHPGGEVVSQQRKHLHSYTYTWNTELEWKEDIRDFDKEAKFPAIMAIAYAERKDGTHYGLIRQMKDPQREINKRRSKLLHLLNTNRVTFVDGAFDDEEIARAEFHKSDGWVKVRNPTQVQVEKHLDVSMTQFQLLQQAMQEVDAVGTGREVEGQSSGSSGREIQLRQQIAVQPIRKLFNNIRDARRRVALYVLDDIARELPPEHQITKYDVVIDEAPETINLESETFEQLVKLASSGIPIPPDMLIRLSPLPEKVKGEFESRMQQQQQMQAQMAPQGQQPAA